MEKNKKLVIIGAGETGALAYEYFTHDSEYSVAAFSVSEKFHLTKLSKSDCGTSVTSPIIAKICSRATRAVDVFLTTKSTSRQ